MRWNFCTEIAGVYYHRQKLESGTFDGYIRHELNNPHDSEAIGVYLKDGTLVGYIPKDEKYFLKAWNPDYNNLKGEINLNIEKEWDRYSGTISIKTSGNYINPNPLRDKKIYVCKNIQNNWEYSFLSIGSTFGVIYNNQLKLDTDYVVYEGSVPKMVMDKKEGGRYHFELLSITEFIMMGITREDCDQRFYGKTVYVKGKRGGSYARHIHNFILENGGCLVDTFSKKCDVALNFGEGFAPTVQERITKYGIPIISTSSILNKPTIYIPFPSTNGSASSKGTTKRSEDKDVQFKSNQVLVVVLALAVILILFLVMIK